MFLFGKFDTLFVVLTALIVLDFLSGVLEAACHGKLSSSVGFKGITKKIFIFFLVAAGFLVQQITGDMVPLREIIITFFISNEALSILENATKLGVPFPNKLKEILLKLKNSDSTEQTSFPEE